MNKVIKLPSGSNSDAVARTSKPGWQEKWLGLQITHAAVQELADVTEAWCGRFARNRRNRCVVVAYGPSGTGKTHVARKAFQFCQSAATWAWENGFYANVPGTAFYKWPAVADGFKRGEFSVLDDIFDLDTATFIDDIGAEYDPSQMGVDKLCQILSQRENAFTFITTNIVPTQWPTRFDSRIADRLLRNSVLVDLAGVESFALQAV